MPALVIEGGANRSAYATGVLLALQRAGIVPDAVYGTSAGGALGAWYAAGQMEKCGEIWSYAADRRIMSYRRALVGKHIFDLRMLYRVMYLETFGMDIETLKKAPYPVIITTTNADNGRTNYVDIRHTEHPTHWIHAGAAIPIAAEAPVEIGGERFLDGGTTDPIPIRKAIDDGHRDIVAVLNRPRGERKPEREWAIRMFARLFPNLEYAARDHHKYHNQAVRLAENPPDGVRVRIVRPVTDTGLSRTTRDEKALRRGIDLGRRDGEAALRSWRAFDEATVDHAANRA